MKALKAPAKSFSNEEEKKRKLQVLVLKLTQL